jgi:hypothetical protein
MLNLQLNETIEMYKLSFVDILVKKNLSNYAYARYLIQPNLKFI